MLRCKKLEKLQRRNKREKRSGRRSNRYTRVQVMAVSRYWLRLWKNVVAPQRFWKKLESSDAQYVKLAKEWILGDSQPWKQCLKREKESRLT
jgi:hypothetical protein